MNIDDFDFEFPDSLVAQYARPRGQSRLLFCPKDQDQGQRQELGVSEIVDLLNPEDCLVLNNTKVIPARIKGSKDSGSPWEILLIQPDPLDPVLWQAMVRPGKHFKVDKCVEIMGVRVETLEVRSDGIRVLKFHTSAEEFKNLLTESGKIPLPPYIQREASPEDSERYQTLWAKSDGAVAAPTASLHFSQTMLQALKDKGIALAEVTLHVGPGTFKPVEVQDPRDHQIHAERFELCPESAELINDRRRRGGRIIAVGTTAVRVLESCADDQGLLKPQSGSTQIYIYPGYHWKIVDGLMTNFHWPKSTLLLLVSSFYGQKNCLDAYQEAIDKEFQLFSYGDAMLIL